jgi:hypothetical protein
MQPLLLLFPCFAGHRTGSQQQQQPQEALRPKRCTATTARQRRQPFISSCSLICYLCPLHLEPRSPTHATPVSQVTALAASSSRGHKKLSGLSDAQLQQQGSSNHSYPLAISSVVALACYRCLLYMTRVSQTRKAQLMQALLPLFPCITGHRIGSQQQQQPQEALRSKRCSALRHAVTCTT